MKQKTKQLKDKYPSLISRKYGQWKVVLLVIVFSVMTMVMVNFFDNLHYSNLLLQANGQATVAQTQLGKEQYDVKYLIDNNTHQLNCYDLLSTYARNICNTHDHNPANNSAL